MSRRIALIVGVSQYESRTGLHSLSAPVNDAQRVYDVLSEYGDFDMLYPLPLADGEVGSSGKVYAHDLQAKLGEVLSPSADEGVDLAVFYFSGHGVSERGQVVYLSTSDERLAIAIPWLAELVKGCLLTLGGVILYMAIFMALGIGWVGLILIPIAILLVLLANEHCNHPILEPIVDHILVFIWMPIALAVWGRSLVIRIWATLCHPFSGLRYLTSNWRETIWGGRFYPSTGVITWCRTSI